MVYRATPDAWEAAIGFIREQMDLENVKVLDVGLGTGGFSVALAQYADKVVNFDIVHKQIRKFHDRIEQENIENILVSRTDANYMPYKEEMFDLVVINGVLEYTASVQEGDPRDVHIRVLKYVKKLLKPGGLLYIGIENRYYLKFLLGARAHEDMRFATVLPRGLANSISKAFYNEEFRHYVYSYNEYWDLFRDAGFDQVEIFTALPSYKLPQHIISIDDKETIIEKIKQLDTKPLYRFVSYVLAHSNYLYKKIGPDFVILCRK